MAAPTTAPALSTPDTRLAEAPASQVVQASTKSEEQFVTVYEITRTVREIHLGGWKRVALQFPDDLLPDAPRVYRCLEDKLKRDVPSNQDLTEDSGANGLESVVKKSTKESDSPHITLFILGDTSYSACCVDEIAAEHVDADVVVHYGRACLSPPARLPVIHVFTIQDLDMKLLLGAFGKTYPENDARVIVTADMPYASYLPTVASQLREQGYRNVFESTIRHDPSSPIPNRTIPPDAEGDPNSLKSWSLFHISEPPQALLLTLASCLDSIYIYPTKDISESPTALQASTSFALRRRYALVTRFSRASIIGILVNTLSVHAYQAALEGTQARIAAAGKKSYVFAMGRLNSAKLANFAEVDGWVVLSCWESSLVENTEFDKPVITPFELELALQSDENRIWTGEWRGDFGNMTEPLEMSKSGIGNEYDGEDGVQIRADDGWQQLNSDSESEPPEFDFRTGQYVTPSRSTKGKAVTAKGQNTSGEHSLVKRTKGDLAIIGGEISPGAQFLRDKRSWRGLGSDFEIAYEEEDKDTTAIKEGRSGIAKGYQNEKSIQ